MRGQTKIIIFLILFFIGLIIIASVNLWGRGIIQQNVDLVKIETAEDFMKNLDNTIFNLVEYGGNRRVNYNMEAPIQVIGDNTIEMNFKSAISIPAYWINLSSTESSYIRERMDGELFRIQIIYPSSDYRIELFTNGSSMKIPEYIFLIKNDTYDDSGQTVIKIEISFMK